MKVLVTGGAGFMGSFFVRLLCLLKDFVVVVVDKLTYAGDMARLRDVFDRIRFYRVDVTDKQQLEEIFDTERPEFVVHYCAETHVDRSIISPDTFLITNVVGTHNLLQLSLKYGVKKFINISTDEVYGETFDGWFREDSPLRPNSPYAVSKASQDMLGQAYFRTYGLPVVTVRPCNNFGPFQYPEKFIPASILRLLLGEPICLYGDGQNVREWLYVEDSAEGILRVLIDGKPGEIYNMGSGVELRNIEVAEMILDIMGKGRDFITFVKDRPGHDYRYALNSEKIRNELSWMPGTSFEEGLRKTVEWYIANREWLFEKHRALRDLWKVVYQTER